MAASVARHQLQQQQQPTQKHLGATSMMARVERLDLVLGCLEEMMQQQQRRGSRSTPATSSPSTPPAATCMTMMSGDESSAASTPRGSKSWRRASSWCRPANEALEEAQAKGTLVDRIAFLEDRVLKMEEDMDIITPEKTTMTMSDYGHDARDHRSSSSSSKKGLKSFVKSCVTGKLKTKD